MRRSQAKVIAIFGLAVLWSLVSVAQEKAISTMSPQDVVAKAKELQGQSVTSAGVVEGVVKDGMSSRSFILVLKGNLRCRMSFDEFETSGRKVELKKSKWNPDVALYLSTPKYYYGSGADQLLLGRGDTVTVSGTVKLEMGKPVLNGATITKTSNPRLRSALQLWY